MCFHGFSSVALRTKRSAASCSRRALTSPSLVSLMTAACVLSGFSLCLSLTDPSASQTHSEERLDHEAQELEKRLSMLSHRSSAGRAALL